MTPAPRPPRGHPAAAAAVLCLLALGYAAPAHPATYYITPEGSDDNTGLAPDQPWASPARLLTANLQPGDTVRFRRDRTFRDPLVAPASGLAGLPITFTSYGGGAKPRFVGSDRLDPAAFAPVAGTASTFRLANTDPVYALLADQQFINDAWLKTNKPTDPTVPRAFVDANPGSFFYDPRDASLYLNLGSTTPAADPRAFDAVRRDDMVYSNAQSHLVFRGLVTTDTARYDRGYGFRIMNGADVRVEDSEAYRAGKHHFGVINTDNFIGENLFAAHALPDQGLGGATAYVSYANRFFPDADHTWRNIATGDLDPLYPAFFTHGPGMGDLLIEGAAFAGNPLSLGNESGRVVVRDTVVRDSDVRVGGSNVLLDGLTVDGGRLTLRGDDVTLQNSLVVTPRTNWQSGEGGAVTIEGARALLRFNTLIDADADGRFNNAAVVIRGEAGHELTGNVLVSPANILVVQNADPADLNAGFNVFSRDGTLVFRNADGVLTLTLDAWADLVSDPSSIVGMPAFLDAAALDYRLADGSPGLGMFGLDPTLLGVPTDRLGNPRPPGGRADAGAFTRRTLIPEPALLLPLAATLLLQRRRRR